jgi:hypothetical protein
MLKFSVNSFCSCEYQFFDVISFPVNYFFADKILVFRLVEKIVASQGDVLMLATHKARIAI